MDDTWLVTERRVEIVPGWATRVAQAAALRTTLGSLGSGDVGFPSYCIYSSVKRRTFSVSDAHQAYSSSIVCKGEFSSYIVPLEALGGQPDVSIIVGT